MICPVCKTSFSREGLFRDSRGIFMKCSCCDYRATFASTLAQLTRVGFASRSPEHVKATIRLALDGDLIAEASLCSILQRQHLPNIFESFDQECVSLLIKAIKAAGRCQPGFPPPEDWYTFNHLAVSLINLLMASAGGPPGFIAICGPRIHEFDQETVSLLETKIADAAFLLGNDFARERIKSGLVPLIRQLQSE